MDNQRSASASGSYSWVFAVVLVLALAVFGVGVYLAAQQQRWELLAAGCVSVVLVLSAWSFSLNSIATRTAQARKLDDLSGMMGDRLQQISVMLNTMSEQQLLSERAKAVAFREKDVEVIRRAIREDLARRDWESALVLANDIESTFGYKAEAEKLKEEISNLRYEQTRRQIGDGIAVIDRYCRDELWNQAWREAERLGRIYSDDAQVKDLPIIIENRRQGFKKQLLDSWNDAVARHDVDGAIEILKKLDLYLTPAEAESMQETARRVFKDKIAILGQQFSNAVREGKWAEAIRLGETIMRDFPNAVMAQEVAAKLPVLREKAAEPAEAART